MKFQTSNRIISTIVIKENNPNRMLERIIMQNEYLLNPLGIKAHQFTLTYSMLTTVKYKYLLLI